MRIEDGVVYFDKLIDDTGKMVSIPLPVGYDPNDSAISEFLKGLGELSEFSAKIDVFFYKLRESQISDDGIPKFTTAEMWDYFA